MALVLFDTNILIDFFAGHLAASVELSNYKDAIISSISWIEVACKLSAAQQLNFGALLAGAGIAVVHIDDTIMFKATEIRRDTLTRAHKLALPDCIIRATADAVGRIVVTRNPGDFGGEGPMVHVPYDIVDGTAVNTKPALL